MVFSLKSLGMFLSQGTSVGQRPPPLMGIPELVKAALSTGRSDLNACSLQQPPGPPKHPHLAQAVSGFCVTASHRSANEMQVVLGLLHLPYEKWRRLQQAMLSTAGTLQLVSAHQGS